MRAATLALTAALVAALLTAPCCGAESDGVSGAAASAPAPADGSRFGNARPASVRAAAPADSPPPPLPPADSPTDSAPATAKPPVPVAASAPPPEPAPTPASSDAPEAAAAAAPASPAAARTLASVPGVPLPAAPDASEASANVLRSVGAPPPAQPASVKTSRSIGGWNMAPNTQYHIQTDEGPERYFKYQTISGQYRKEKRLQDGTVVGTYGWVDPNGFLRLRDYVADNAGYRVLKTKMVFVGKDDISSAVAKAKHVPSQGGTAYVPPRSTAPATTPAPAPSPAYTQPPFNAPYSYTNPLYSSSAATPPSNSIAAPYNSDYYNDLEARRFDNFNFGYRLQPQAPFPQYDGVSATHNGFRYYLPRHYHEEETLPSQQRSGSFGYIDPFGIRRVIYYNTSPGSGFVHRKNNRYVGFNATPYDPRF